MFGQTASAYRFLVRSYKSVLLRSRLKNLTCSVALSGALAGGVSEARAQSAESAFSGQLRGAIFYYQGPNDPDMDHAMVTLNGDRVTAREAMYHMGDSYSRFVAACSGGLMDINFDFINLAITSDNNGTPWGLGAAADAFMPAGYKRSDYTYVTPVYSDTLSSTLVNKTAGVGDLRMSTSRYSQAWAYIGGVTPGSGYYLHEFGHNLGLMHAGRINYDLALGYAYTYDYAAKQYVKVDVNFDSTRPAPDFTPMYIGGSSVRAYGSPVNLMAINGSFSPRQKAQLGWMPQTHFINLNRVVAPGATGSLRIYDDMADMNVVVTGTGADRSYSVEKGYNAALKYNAYITRQAQNFHVNADGVTGQWATFAQTLDLYYRASGITYPGSDGPYDRAESFVVEIDGNYMTEIKRGQTLLERGFNDALMITSCSSGETPLNMDDGTRAPAGASPDILTYNGGNPGAPRDPNRMRTTWYKFTFLDSGVDANGHWGELQVECLTGMDVYGWKWDASSGTAGAQDGSGVWTTGAGNWSNITALVDNQTWKDGEDAVFGAGSGAAGTITLGSDVSAFSLTFRAPGSGQYTLANGPFKLTLGGGGIYALASATINTDLVLGTGQIWEVDTDKTLTIGGTVSGAFGLTKMGRGTLVLNAANTWQGGLMSVDGTIVQNASQTFSDSAKLNIGADAIYRIQGGTLTVGSGGIENSGAFRYSFSNGSGFRVNQGGTLVFARTDSSVDSPELRITGGGTATIGNDVVLEAGMHYLEGKPWVGDDTVFTGSISGAGGIAISKGLFTLIGKNTFTGDILLRGGALQLEGYQPIVGGNRVSFDVASGSTAVLHLGGFDRTISDLSSTGAGVARIANWTGSSNAGKPVTLTVDQRANGAFSGIISDGTTTTGGTPSTVTPALSLRKTGAGTLTLTGANVYTGGTTIEQGALRILGGGNLGTGSVKLAGGTLSFEQTQGLSKGTIAGATLDTTTAPTGRVYTNNLSDLHTSSSVSGVSGINRTFTGQIYLTAGTWSFGENFDDAAYLSINGTRILNDTNWGSGSYGSITIANAGWYSIDLRVANSGGGGPMGDEGWTLDKGIGIKSGAVVTGATAGASYSTFDLPTLNGLGLALRDVNTFGNAVELVSNSTIEVMNTYLADAEVVMTGGITGTGDLTKTGPGALVLSGSGNTYTGATRVNAGAVAAANAGAFSSKSAVVLANAAGVSLDLRNFDQTVGSLAGGGALGGVVSLGSATLTTGADNTSAAFAGVITGTGGFTKTGSGTQTLSGKNTYTGATTVTGGTLALDFSAGTLTSDIIAAGSTLTLDRGVLQVKGRSGATLTQTFNGLVVGSGSNVLRLAANGATSLTVDVGAVTRTGAGTIDFAGITGATGNARVKTTTGAAGQLLDGGAQWATVNGAEWAAKDATNTYVTAYTGYVDVYTAAGTGKSATIPNVANANVRILENGAGSGNPVAASVTAINSLLMSAGATAAKVNLSGGVLVVGETNSGAIAVASGAKSLTIGATPGDGALTVSATDGAKTLTVISNNAAAADGVVINSVIRGSASGTTRTVGLIVSGGANGGTVTLAGANTYSDGTRVTNNGTLRVGNAGASGTLGTGAVAVDAGASLAFNRTDTALAVANVISGEGAVRQIAAGTVALTGANSYAGGTFITAGRLEVSGAGTFGTGAVTVVGGASAGANGATNLTIANAITGAGAFVKSGTGTATLTGENTATGGITVSAGTLQVGDGGVTGSVLGAVSVASGATFAVNRSDSVTFAGTLSGAGRLAQNGAGTLTVATAQSHTGGTTIAGGTLELTGSGTLGTGAVTDNATLRANAATAGSTLTIANAISGTGRLLADGPGVVVLTGANAYSGETRIASGATVRIATGGSVGAGNIVNHGTLDFAQSGTSIVAGSILGRDADLLYARGVIEKSGTGTIILTADNEWVSSVNIRFGEFRLGAGGAGGSMNDGVFTIDAPGTLVYDTSSGQRTAGLIQGAGAVRQAGTDTVIFTNNHTYTGGTTVEVGGTLQVGDGATAGSLGTGALRIDGTVVSNRTGTWAVSGAISGAGTLRQIGAGTLDLTADGTYTGNAVVDGGILKLSNASALGTGTVTVNAGGTLNYAKSGNATLTSSVALNGGVFNISQGDRSAMTGTLTLNGGTFNMATYWTQLTLAGGVAVNGAIDLRLNSMGPWWVPSGNGVSMFVDGLMTGSGSLNIGAYDASQTSVGRIVFNNAANTYSGTLNVANIVSGANAQVIGIGSGTALRYATLNLAAAGANRDMVEFRNITSATLGGLNGTALSGVKLQSSGTDNPAVALTVNNAVANTYAGILYGTGSLIKTGAGTLTLTGANTYAGGTTVGGGTLALDFSAAGAPVSNILASGALVITGGSTLRITGTAGQNGVVQTFAGLTGGTGANTLELVRNGATTLDVSVGDIAIAGGTLNFKGGTGVAAGARFITTTGAGLNDGNSQLSGESALWNGTQFASVQRSGGVNYVVAWSGTYADVYTGTAGGKTTTVPNNATSAVRILENGGTGALTLAAATTTVNSLMMAAGTTSATLDTAGKTLVVGTGAGSSWNVTLTASARPLTIGNAVGDGFLTSGDAAGVSTIAFSNLNASANLTVNSVVKDNGVGTTAVRVAGGSRTILAAANTYTGGTSVALGSTLRLNQATSAGTGAIANDGILEVNATGTLDNTVSGAGALTTVGAGNVVTITAANTYTGLTTVAAGTTLNLSGVGTFGSSTGTVVNNGVIQINTAGSFSRVISGSGSLEKNSGGETYLYGANTYTNGTTINSGTIRVGNDSALGTGTLTIAGAGERGLSTTPGGGVTTVANNVVLNSGTTLKMDAGYRSIVFTGNISGAGALRFDAGSANVLRGNNTFTGGTLLNARATSVYGAHANAFGTGVVSVATSGSTLGGFADFKGLVTLASGTTLAPGAASAVSGTAGVMSFNAGLTLNSGSAFRWNFDGNSLAVAGTDYGQVRITAGTMAIAGSGAGVNLLLNAGTGVDYANTFWATNHSLLIADATASGLITGTFAAVDTTGAGAFAGRGSWAVRYTGGDVYMDWTASAIPEPSTYGLLGTGALALGALVRRRRKLAA